jgi:LytS/YehU family sensor histidine kinase
MGLDELEELQAAFHGMRAKLRQSTDEALWARAHEMKAILLALQSQMDPHFVCDMLTSIGTMAEEAEYARRRMACMEVCVPKLILQPIIEHTIKYGLSGRSPRNVEIIRENGGGCWSLRTSPSSARIS